jgi:hypothetical protein|tara:strand:- start:10978 stop:12075 length:1098 start_codon:yes stop_codon:yes gene_type:complete
MAIVFKDNIEVPDIEIGGVALGTLAFSSATIPTDNNQLANGAGYVTSSGNTTIGINQNNTLNTATVFATLNFTNGVATSATTRTLTLANLGITGSGGNSGNWNTAYQNSVTAITTSGTSTTTITLGQPQGVISASFSNPQGTVTGIQASASGNGLGVTVTNPSSAPVIALAYQGLSSEYINGVGNRVTFPQIPSNNNQLTNGAGYITSVPPSNKGSWSPENAQTIAGSGSLEARVTIEFDTSEITEVGMTASSAGEVSITSAQLVMISFNFASENGASANRLLAGAVLQYAPYRGSYADIQGTQVFNYVRGNGTVDRDSGSATVLYNVGALSKIRAQFWIQGRAASASALISLISGCRLSINQIT